MEAVEVAETVQPGLLRARTAALDADSHGLWATFQGGGLVRAAMLRAAAAEQDRVSGPGRTPLTDEEGAAGGTGAEVVADGGGGGGGDGGGGAAAPVPLRGAAPAGARGRGEAGDAWDAGAVRVVVQMVMAYPKCTL